MWSWTPARSRTRPGRSAGPPTSSSCSRSPTATGSPATRSWRPSGPGSRPGPRRPTCTRPRAMCGGRWGTARRRSCAAGSCCSRPAPRWSPTSSGSRRETRACPPGSCCPRTATRNGPSRHGPAWAPCASRASAPRSAGTSCCARSRRTRRQAARSRAPRSRPATGWRRRGPCACFATSCHGWGSGPPRPRSRSRRRWRAGRRYTRRGCPRCRWSAATASSSARDPACARPPRAAAARCWSRARRASARAASWTPCSRTPSGRASTPCAAARTRRRAGPRTPRSWRRSSRCSRSVQTWPRASRRARWRPSRC